MNTQADLWSVGAILFQLVTGKTPFTGNNQIQVFFLACCIPVSFFLENMKWFTMCLWALFVCLHILIFVILNI